LAAASYGTTHEEMFDVLTEDLDLSVFDLAAWLNNGDPLGRARFADESRGEFFFVAAPG
jgi:hypothetical protein